MYPAAVLSACPLPSDSRRGPVCSSAPMRASHALNARFQLSCPAASTVRFFRITFHTSDSSGKPGGAVGSQACGPSMPSPPPPLFLFLWLRLSPSVLPSLVFASAESPLGFGFPVWLRSASPFLSGFIGSPSFGPVASALAAGSGPPPAVGPLVGVVLAPALSTVSMELPLEFPSWWDRVISDDLERRLLTLFPECASSDSIERALSFLSLSSPLASSSLLVRRLGYMSSSSRVATKSCSSAQSSLSLALLLFKSLLDCSRSFLILLSFSSECASVLCSLASLFCRSFSLSTACLSCAALFWACLPCSCALAASLRASCSASSRFLIRSGSSTSPLDPFLSLESRASLCLPPCGPGRAFCRSSLLCASPRGGGPLRDPLLSALSPPVPVVLLSILLRASLPPSLSRESSLRPLRGSSCGGARRAVLPAGWCAA